MRPALVGVAAVVGALCGLLLVAFLRLGARPCVDVVVVETAACSSPQAAAWALALSGAAGTVLGVLVARRVLR